jgi:hypothetical protein
MEAIDDYIGEDPSHNGAKTVQIIFNRYCAGWHLGAESGYDSFETAKRKQ